MSNWWTDENYSIKFLYNRVFSKPFEFDYNLFLFKVQCYYECSTFHLILFSVSNAFGPLAAYKEILIADEHISLQS